MKRNIKFLLEYIVMVLSNAQQSCVPATALGVWLFAIRLGTESINFLVLRGQKKLILVFQGQKILIFGAPGTENIDI